MSLTIDLQFREIGRIHVRSGTKKKAVRDAMKNAFRLLYQQGKLDHLRDLKAGRISAMALYDRIRTNRLDTLPTGELVRDLARAWDAWLAGKELAGKTVADYEQAKDRLVAFKAGAIMTDLPALLTAHRTASRGVHPRTFNRDRAAALSFLSTTVGDRHWLYLDCTRVEALKVTSPMRKNPQTIAELRVLATKLEPHHARTLWAYALTGMRPEEMFQEDGNTWALETDRVRIGGTKRPASNRVVPRVGVLTYPTTKRRAFAKALATASGDTVTPYDLRRSYAQILDLARIPQFRQDYYMAHGPTNLNELYKRAKECQQHLFEDAAAIEALVSEPVALRMVK